jgi:hypothetical protein
MPTGQEIDRTAAARALAKCIAYANSKPATAQEWFVALAAEVGMTDMLAPDHRVIS